MIKPLHSKIILKFGGAGGWATVHIEKCLFKKQKGRFRDHLGEKKNNKPLL
jgi:hypothetical protein